ncbi:MAG: type III-B CRISPR module RAMP protein Cmr4 [Paracoccaceae bacterium]|nr:MAG: type III-B CRISPR module RAMP protein Cmr4 [Paracoccaceae bacterium]
MAQPARPIVLGLVAETHVHVGIGQSVEGIDLPIARERTTHWPFVPGSGVKGAFRVWAQEQAKIDSIDTLFGRTDADDGAAGNAGMLMFSDAKLVLLPVRALNRAWRWVTSPGLLRRYQRDLARAGLSATFSIPSVEQGKWLGAGAGWLGLEEREFEHAGAVDQPVVEALRQLTGESADAIRKRLVILNDDDFVWFALYGVPVMARNALDENKRVRKGALWYEESLAPDSVLYVLIGERVSNGPDAVGDLRKGLSDAPYIQMGGNETIGQGWFRMVELSTGGADGQA